MSTSDVTIYRSVEVAAQVPVERDCVCCSPTADASGPVAGVAATSSKGGHSSRYEVEGMTCDHCLRAVTLELTRLPGVRAVDVDLVAGGVSAVVVTSDRPLDVEDVRAAIDEAGYELRG